MGEVLIDIREALYDILEKIGEMEMAYYKKSNPKKKPVRKTIKKAVKAKRAVAPKASAAGVPPARALSTQRTADALRSRAPPAARRPRARCGETSARFHREVRRRPLRFWPLSAEWRDRDNDQTRIGLGQCWIAEAQPIRITGSKGLDQDIRGFHQLKQVSATGRGLKIDRAAALIGLAPRS